MEEEEEKRLRKQRARLPLKRILFIVSPQNVYSVLYHAGEEQYSDLLLSVVVVVQRLTVVNVTMERYARSDVDCCFRLVYCLYLSPLTVS